jgi:uncharacterized protein (TIGR02246 family)
MGKDDTVRKTPMILGAGGLLALLIAGLVGMGYGQPARSPAGAREADEEAIRKSSLEFVRAFQKADAKAIAAMWTEGAEYRDDSGDVIRGRAEIEKAYADYFKSKPKGKIEVDVGSIRFLSRDAAIEEGVLRLIPSGADLPSSTYYTALHVREDGRWKIAAVTETGAAEDKLEDLAWLIGAWTGKVKDREIQMSFEWNARKTQIENRFSVKEGGKVISTGTQKIALDPQTGRIRSWMHDEEGGHGQSLWHRDGNGWALQSLGVTSDGRETSATNLLTRVSNDELIVRSTHREIDGNEVPDTEPVKITRVKTAR